MINYLIFDGNFIFHKCVQSLCKTNRFYEHLYNLLEMTINKYVSLNRWDKIIIVSDSRKPSWRTRIKGDYKGHRVRDESIDWKFAYDTYNMFKQDMKEKYIVLEHDHIEGDDWIYFLTQYANKQGLGACTISSDRDLYQMIKYDLKKGYMNVQIADKSNDEKIIIPVGWEVFVNSLDDSTDTNNLFSLDVNDGLSFFNYCTTRFNVKEINNKGYFFTKILTGDKGDNVDTVHKTLTKNGNSFRGIGEKTAEKVWETYSITNNDFSTSNKDDLTLMIESYELVKKINLSDNERKTIYNNVVRNIELMELKQSMFPDDIKYTIIDKILEELEND